MLKCKLVRGYCHNGYDMFIYEEDSQGNNFQAKPLKIEFDTNKYSDGLIVEPTIRLPARTEIDLDQSLNSETKLMLRQKDDDMERHIKSLEKIIEMLVKK